MDRPRIQTPNTKIFHLEDPGLLMDYARFSHIGTWSNGKLCNKCLNTSQKLIPPLQIEWEPDSDFIGDLSWCGYIAIAKETISDFLCSNGFEFKFEKVEIFPTSSKKGKKKLVPFPYVGPKLCWLFPEVNIPINQQRSDIGIRKECKECGMKKYGFRRTNLYIDSTQWNGEKVFRIKQFNSFAMFVSEEGKNIIENSKISNVKLSEAGCIC